MNTPSSFSVGDMITIHPLLLYMYSRLKVVCLATWCWWFGREN